ncbi:MAG: 1-acyl-sn-glycerol-3-phosphate acyltransferase [Myxococcales bacterium]|nr:1-acyl-sn-glycerol-3-phosphate acyltransferase [Myxococcales bacterium]
MFYRFARTVIGFALGLFYRIKVSGDAHQLDGPLIFVGNHPNSLIDPALVFVVTHRHVTFLAKAPLFRLPLIGHVLRALGALPVYRRQDDPSQMDKNQGTFEAASQALKLGRAITIFPEGRSHSEPHLTEIKTGCARIAFRAAKEGARVRIVPVGLTYAQKHRFRSWVLIEVGSPVEVAPLVERQDPTDDSDAVRRLTERIADGLSNVTLNLENWEDLPLIQTAEALYAFRLGERSRDPERIRRFAKGLQLFRREQPSRFERLRDEVMTFRRRLQLVHADPRDLTLQYRRSEVYRFVLRNAAALSLGFPLFALGCALYSGPFLFVRWLSRTIRVAPDRVATVKFVASLFLAPIWWALLTLLAWWAGGPLPGAVALLGALPLALFTRYFLERRHAAAGDVLAFLILGSRARLKARLLVEGERLAAEIEALVAELRPRVVGPADEPAAPRAVNARG